jgi:hypothetical protein
MKLTIKHQLIVDEAFWDFDQHILDARRIGDKIIVIFDYMDFPKPQQAKNLMAFDLDKKLLWVAEHPSTKQTDTYVNIISETPLKVSNFASYICEIDEKTGKLCNTVFTK